MNGNTCLECHDGVWVNKGVYLESQYLGRILALLLSKQKTANILCMLSMSHFLKMRNSNSNSIYFCSFLLALNRLIYVTFLE